jgi:hypothetical protein
VPTGAKRTIGGIQAARYAPIDRPGDPSEVWWAADQHLPIAFTIANGAEMTRMSVERVEVGTDPNRLRPPAVQSPSYAVVQFADWLEHH